MSDQATAAARRRRHRQGTRPGPAGRARLPGLPPLLARRRLRHARRAPRRRAHRRDPRLELAALLSEGPSIDPEKAGARPGDPRVALPRRPADRLLGAARRRHGGLPRGVRAEGPLVQPHPRAEHPEPRRRAVDRLRHPRPRVHRPRASASAGAPRRRAHPHAARPSDGDRRRRARRSGRCPTRSARAPSRSGRRSGRSSAARCCRRRFPESPRARSSASLAAIGETAPLLLVGALAFVSFNPTLAGLVHGAADPDLPVDRRARRTSSRRSRRRRSSSSCVMLLGLNAFAIWLRNRYQQRW